MLIRDFLIRLLRRAILGLKDLAKRSGLVKTLLYDLQNRETFTDLRWHERMLTDSVRVNAYRNGIARRVGPGDVVMDLGTGTGLLAFFAARRNAKQVYAVDHSSFIEVAKEIGKRNGFKNIQFVNTNSRDFSPPERVDVIIHEQLNRTLFGENMIENLLDLKRRALKPGGCILPAQFDLFIEPAVMNRQYFFPHIWDISDIGLDLAFLKNSSVIEPYRTREYWFQSAKTIFTDYFLCEPQALMSIDIDKIASADEIPTKFELSRKVVREGILDGFCVYFRARFDEQTFFDTSPMSQQTSWENLIFRTGRKHFDAGDRISYSVDLSVLTDSTTWKLSLKDASMPSRARPSEPRVVERVSVWPATERH